MAAIVFVLVLTLAAPLARAQSQAALTPPHSDVGIDTNANTLFDILQVNVVLDVTVAGAFTIAVDLYDNTGFTYITSGYAFPTLPLGANTVPVDLPGADIYNAGFNGPYTAEIFVLDDVFNLDDFGTHMTAAYLFSDFEQPAAAFAPPHSDTTIDTDGDTLYDWLRVNAVVDVSMGDTFDLYATAYDSSFNFIANAFTTVSLPPGAGQTIAVDFPGWPFRANGVDGPYPVDLYLYGSSGFLDYDSHLTAFYAANNFETPPGYLTPPHSDRGIDTDGDPQFNAIEVNVSLQINSSADYYLAIDFWDSTHTTYLGGNFSFFTLGASPQVISMWKSTLQMVVAGIPGPYQVDITLLDASFNQIDTGTHTTQAYALAQFDPIPATFAPPHADAGEDRDAPPDGQFNLLRVDVSLDVNESGSYAIFADLWDQTFSTLITSELVITTLVVGPQTVPVYFSGVTIRQSGIDGPYVVDMALLTEFFTLVDADTHTTQGYLATDFQSTTPGTLSGVIRDSTTSTGIPFATVDAFDYTNYAMASTSADGSGSYTLPVYQGDWVVVYDDFAHNAALTPVTVGASTTLNVNLNPSPPESFYGNVTLTTWNTLDLQVENFLQNDVVTIRQMIDWTFGNRNQTLSQAEFDAFLAFIGFVPPDPLNSTWNVILTDSIWYELVPGSDSFAIQDVSGPIGSTVPLELMQTARYQNGTIAPAGTHTIRVNVTFDSPFQDGHFTLVLPAGYVLQSYTVERPGVTVTGIGSATVIVEPGQDPDPFDGFDYSWVTLNVFTPDTVNPTISSVGAAPDPVVVGNAVTISASASDNIGIATVWLQAWNPSGTLVVDAPMNDAGSGNYNYGFSPSAVGTWTFNVTATDFAGNAVTATDTFVAIETTPPTIIGPSATPSPQEFGQSVLFAATVTDNVALQTVKVEVRDSTNGFVGNFTMTYNATSGDYEYSAPILELGTNTYTIWATDTSGNVASAGGTFQIVDTTDPVLSNVVAAPDPVQVGSAVLISVTATDLAGIQTVVVQVTDPGNVVSSFSMTYNAASGKWQYSYTPTDVGTYGFTITATDVGGNTASAPPDTFASQDTTDPVANAGTDQTVNVGATVTFTGAGSSDNDAITNYTWEFQEGTSTVRLYTASPTHVFATAGVYTVTLTVTDASGNTATDTVTITVQQPPGGVGEFPGWALILIVLVIVGGLVGFLLFWRRRKAVGAPPGPPAGEGSMQGQPPAPSEDSGDFGPPAP